MKISTKLVFLRIALVLFGAFFIFGIYPMMQVWPAGWQWTPSQYEYEQMIMGIYATLGVFLIIAARRPTKHLSLIWFTVWSSLVHGGIMGVQAVVDRTELVHLIGDVPALLIVALVLAYLTPREKSLSDIAE